MHFIFKNAGLVKGVVVCVCVAKGGATHMTTLEDLYTINFFYSKHALFYVKNQ